MKFDIGKFFEILSIKFKACVFSVDLIRGRDLILGQFAKLQKATLSFVMSVRLRGTIRFPLGAFS
jgi:hypothetical protein